MYRSLLDILQAEKKAVISAKLEDVTVARIRKENILSLIRVKDEIRNEIIEKISGCLGCQPKDLTLHQLSQRVEVPFSLKLIQCAADISLLIQNIHQANEMNKSLITYSLKLINSSINLITQIIRPPSEYFHNGKIRQGISGTVFSSSI